MWMNLNPSYQLSPVPLFTLQLRQMSCQGPKIVCRKFPILGFIIFQGCFWQMHCCLSTGWGPMVYQVAFCFSVNKIWWNRCCILLLEKQSSLTDSMVGTFVYQVLNFGLSSCTLVYKVALWSIKLHFDLSCCILVYQVAFSFSDQVAFWSIKLYFGLSSCI